MKRNYDIIDADGHVMEPADLWKNYIDPAYRDRAPSVIVDTDGRERFLIDGRIFGGPKGIALGGAVGMTDKDQLAKLTYATIRKGSYDPHARIADLDLDGIDAVFIYPTLGLLGGAIEEPAFAAAVCRAYNRWLADYCKACPDRLFGVAMLPMQSVEHAVGELKFARESLGMTSGFVRPNPYNNRLLSDPAYDPIWAVAQELDFPIGVHEGTGGMPSAGADRVPNAYGARHIASHTIEMMLASLNIIWGGVCERFPKVRFAFLESGGGWMPSWLDRMDRHYERVTMNDSNLRMKPSDYFKRQCWVSFEPIEGTIAAAAAYLGADKILWATDYPHHDGFFPGAPKTVSDRLPPELRQQVMSQSAMDFYGMGRG